MKLEIAYDILTEILSRYGIHEKITGGAHKIESCDDKEWIMFVTAF